MNGDQICLFATTFLEFGAQMYCKHAQRFLKIPLLDFQFFWFCFYALQFGTCPKNNSECNYIHSTSHIFVILTTNLAMLSPSSCLF